MEKLILKKKVKDEAMEALRSTYVDESHFDRLITFDCDAYDVYGNLIARFRKGVLPIETLKLGVDSFKKSIGQSHNRGDSAGGYFFETKTDGTLSKARMSASVESGIVGALEGGGLNPFCRLTAFTAAYFSLFKAGIPFVQAVDDLYRDLVPDRWRVQKEYAKATNRNYVIGDTVFTTVTVNRNFRTAVHQDAGDLQKGFGNLIAYREGTWTGGYFCLPQFRVAFDLENTDVLFVDVHQFHSNTPFYRSVEDEQEGVEMTEWPDDMLRISFVLYYREDIIKCPSPTEELKKMKKQTFGFNKL